MASGPVSGPATIVGPAPAPVLPAADVRWAGALLTSGALLFVLGIVASLELFSGAWDTSVGATLPDTAAVIRERWSSFRWTWSGELLGALFMAVAALLLQRRPQTSARWLPASVAWVVVAVGSILVALSYTLTLGSYPSALAVFGDEPALFATLRSGVLFTHAVGSTLQLLGLIAAFATELRLKGRSWPDRLLRGAGGVALVAVLASVGGLLPGPYAAAALFLMAAALGVVIWRSAGTRSASVR